MENKTGRDILGVAKFTLTIIALAFSVVAFQGASTAHATDTDFSDGITVDSIGDGVDADTNDTECNDGSGNCTLRAAIQEANDTAGTQTINFSISGTGVHTISPGSALPSITDVVNIDGYSESDSVENSAISPQPLNGTLIVEINGTSAGGSSSGFTFTGGASGSAGSSIRGLVINRFSGHGVVVAAQNITIAGSYIGTDPTGMIDRGNTGSGVTSDTNVSATQNATIGGLNPEDRNLMSGNEDSAGYPVTGWIIQGNYVGVNADGDTALPNATTTPSGAFSIDDCSNVLVGGTVTGASNVISGNASHGVAPDECPGTVIQGNYIGTDWTGQTAVPNAAGITISRNQTGSLIGGTSAAARNIVSGNTISGIISGSTGGLRIEGNYVGLDIDGTDPIPNGAGMLIGDADTIIGGAASNTRNVVSGNTVFNVSIQGVSSPSSGVEISNNYIGTNAQGIVDSAITSLQGEGVRISADASNTLIGGVGKGNLITGNRGNGIAVRSFTVDSFGITLTPQKISIVGNSIFGNAPGGSVAGAQGLGIDLYTARNATLGFPADMIADDHTNIDVNTNDQDDADTGPNNYMNFPVLNNVVQNGSSLTVNFNLDAADSPTNEYRVEFFANDETDASGNGEGQTYLGSATTTPGDGKVVTLSLSNDTNLTGKVLSATTTALDSTTPSDFGATSEFSRTVAVQAAVSGDLAETGTLKVILSIIAGSTLTLASLALMILAKNKVLYSIK